MRTFANKAKFVGLIEALEKGKKVNIDKLAPWGKLAEEFAELEGESKKIILSSAKNSKQWLPAVLKPAFEFSPENPRIAKWIKANTAKRVTNLTKESKKAITSAIKLATKESLKRGLPPRKTAQIIRASGIGLDERRQVAMINHQFKLMDQGFSGAELNKRLNAEYSRKLRSRSKTIARTEGMGAINNGQKEMWDQIADQGLIDKKKTKKRWHTAPQDQDDICTPMDQTVIPYEDNWELPDGTVVSSPEEAHPNCNCTEEVIPVLDV